MPATASSTRPYGSYWLPLLAATVGALVAATVALWAFYGGAVFQAMITAGIAWCF